MENDRNIETKVDSVMENIILPRENLLQGNFLFTLRIAQCSYSLHNSPLTNFPPILTIQPHQKLLVTNSLIPCRLFFGIYCPHSTLPAQACVCSGKMGQAILLYTPGDQEKVVTHNISAPTQRHPLIDKLIYLRSLPACMSEDI